MDINQIQIELNKNRRSFDKWIDGNAQSLSDYFYGITGEELVKQRFDNFYYHEIRNSLVYVEYHGDKKLTQPFSTFLSLLGTAAEKMAEAGSGSVARTLVIDLPDSPSRFRLQALNEFALVEDIRTDYEKKFPRVLSILDSSRTLFEEGTIRPVVDVLAYYFNRAKQALNEAQLLKEFQRIVALFQDAELVARYPFLGHQILVDLVNGVDPFRLYVVSTTRGCLVPSYSIREVFSSFNKDYYHHPEVDHARDNLWGHTKQVILDNVLVRGRGDFTANTGRITPEDKVMLYCFFNMKKHFFTSYAVFQNVVDSLGYIFRNPDYKPVFIDLGCGPMTSGLALGDLIHQTSATGINMSYLGVDISDAMIAKARSLSSVDVFLPECYFEFYHSWNDITPKHLKQLAGKNNPIIFNASYLFASTSVNPVNLADFVTRVSKSYDNVYFVFQNPNRVDRNLKYEEFKLRISCESLLERSENVRYKAASKEANEDVAYEILKLNR